ncbi:MAG TPA: cyclic nucleotide-binding domain-containing protein [Anaeromyxobacteraceae bacterium]|nr:cyclic nucleotide-binding domain-containing protein [Anaeromyxobacteraceae bacterium]
MADLRALKDKAAELSAKGRIEKAAEAWRAVLKADRGDAASRHKLGDVLRKLGDDESAIAEYRQVADGYARQGLLIRAIAVCKVILEIDPGHRDTQQALADLYARRQGTPGGASSIRGAPPGVPASGRADRIEAAAEPAPAAVLGAEVAEDLAPESADRVEIELAAPGEVILPPSAGAAGDLPPELDLGLAGGPDEESTAYEIILAAAGQARAAGVEEDAVVETDEPLPGGPAPPAGAPALPRIPLFSDLGPAAFRALTERLALRRTADGEAVVEQGEPGEAFYVVASGRFRVERREEPGERVVLARLQEGAFFGEMALLSGEPRAASVISEGEGELLELRAEVLAALCREHPHLADSLQRFYRLRLLANAMLRSPLFRPFGRTERAAIMERFRSRPVVPREVLIREGKPSDGLYVVLSGNFDVWKRKGPEEVRAGALREGDVFGEMSCLRKTPASASVVARRGGTVLRLPRETFDELVTTYPQILELVSELTDERQQTLQAILEGAAEWTDEGMVLV